MPQLMLTRTKGRSNSGRRDPRHSVRLLRYVPLVLCWWIGGEFMAGAEPCERIRTFADGRQPSREIFVSPTGNNSTGTGSRTSPYRSIARALQGADPGTAIRLLPGIHQGGTTISALSGTSNAPIWLGGIPGEERPEIRGGNAALLLSRVRFLIVENLVVSGATVNGINCDDGGDYANPEAARHLLFRNLEIRDIGTGGNHDGLKLSGVNDFKVLDCTFVRMSAGGSGIDQVGCHRGTIARCTFTDMGSNAIQCKGGSEDVEIRGNRFFNGGGRAINVGGSTGLSLFRPPLSTTEPNVEARNIRVLANLFRGSDAPLAFVGAVDCIAAQNTIIEPRRWVLRILQETVSGGGYTFRPCGDNRFINNLVMFNRAQVSTPANVGGNTDPASFQFAHNLWFAADRPTQSRPNLPSTEVGGIYGLNPAFRDAAAGDYSVPATSPAVGKGQSLANPRADLLDRCFAEVPTLGAFEAVPRPSPSADTDGDRLPDDWELAHQLDPLDPRDGANDSDSDGWTNLGEFLAGTDPQDEVSYFRLDAARLDNEIFTFRYSTVLGRVYRVQAREVTGSNEWIEVSMGSGTGSPAVF
ncbi:MAG TPA: hypothetical protein DCE44_12260, partial [Verrucomicrobiales bacterium]|nr:hypothetical protein [Verrucomicrobiales bacterium]